MMTEEELIQRAERARVIVNDPIYADAMKMLKQAIIDQWGGCPARDKEGREWLWNYYQVCMKFEEQFQSIMNSGTLAADAIRQRSRESAVSRVMNYWSRNHG